MKYNKYPDLIERPTQNHVILPQKILCEQSVKRLRSWLKEVCTSKWVRMWNRASKNRFACYIPRKKMVPSKNCSICALTHKSSLQPWDVSTCHSFARSMKIIAGCGCALYLINYTYVTRVVPFDVITIFTYTVTLRKAIKLSCEGLRRKKLRTQHAGEDWPKDRMNERCMQLHSFQLVLSQSKQQHNFPAVFYNDQACREQQVVA